MSDHKDYWPPALEALVPRLNIAWPGWHVYLAEEFGDDGSGGLKLFFISDTPDSYNPDQQRPIRHEFLVPRASYNEVNWLAWCFERFCDLWRHEAAELFMVDGMRPFAPHHGDHENPYHTWFVGDYADTRVRSGESREEYLARLVRGVDSLRTYIRTRKDSVLEGGNDEFNKGAQRALDIIDRQPSRMIRLS